MPFKTRSTRPMATGISTHLGPDHAAGQTLRYGGQTTYAASVLALIDDIGAAVARENGITASPDKARRTPEVQAMWVAMGPTYSKDDGHGFLSDELAFGFRRRGITPMINLRAPFGRTFRRDPGTGAQVFDGAPVDGTGGPHRALPSRLAGTFGADFLANWDPGHASRNFAQRIIDGDLDAWLDAFAADVHAFASLHSFGTESLSGSQHNDKGYDLVDPDDRDYTNGYDKVIIRFCNEPNGGLGNSMASDTPDTTAGDEQFERSRRQVVAAFAYVSDRIRNNPTANDGGGVGNAFFFWCFATQPASKRSSVRYRPGVFGAGPEPARVCWDDGLREGNFVQFIGWDVYDKSGDGDRSVPTTPLRHDQAQYLYHEAIFDGRIDPDRRGRMGADYGRARLPMIIGEWGINLASANNAEPLVDANFRKWDCKEIGHSTAWNEQCRGHWIRQTARDINAFRRTRKNDNRKYNALKAMLYFSMDFGDVGIWSLYADGRHADSDFVPAYKDGTKLEPRPTVPQAASGTWAGDDTPAKPRWFAFKRWAEMQDQRAYGTEFRGHGGAVFDDVNILDSSTDL